MTPRVSLRRALADPALLGDALPGPSWFPWRCLLIAAVGEPLVSEEERAAFRLLTGRDHEPGEMCDTLLVVAGRRSGKTRAMAVLAVYLACLCDWSDCLSLGERGQALFLAPSEKQAGIALRYAVGLLDHSPLLSAMVERSIDGLIQLNNRIDLEVAAANWRRQRGGTSVVVVLDESAFFHSGDGAANSDTELVIAIRPTLATTGGMMLLTSSPSTMEGVVFQVHKRHYGPTGDPRCMVVQASSRQLNPNLSQAVIDRAFEDDATAAESEYGGSFRQAVSAFLTREMVERVVSKEPAAVRLPGITYQAFADVAGGTGGDSFTGAIGHKMRDAGREIAVVDLVFEARSPFDPDVVTERFAKILHQWGVNQVLGDRYANMWPVSAFARHGIQYQVAAGDTSERYLHTLPLFAAKRLVLPDEPRLIDQLCSLRRVAGKDGRESVVHPRGGHDDLATAVCGLLWRLSPIYGATFGSAIIVSAGAPASEAPHKISGFSPVAFSEVGGLTSRPTNSMFEMPAGWK